RKGAPGRSLRPGEEGALVSEGDCSRWNVQAVGDWWDAREPWQRRALAAAAFACLVLAGLRLGGAAGVRAEEAMPVVSGLETTRAAEQLATVTVHVVGAVRWPGVYRLPVGSRVCDAIGRAGGVLGNAAADAVNMARVLSDGEQVRVPTLDESTRPEPIGGTADRPRLVDINRASAEELDALPGIGPSTAQKIVDDRARNGPFRCPQDIMRVPGIGPKKFDALKDLITAG
ncbi:MAG: ComEA family DNA-binding protein, partial [Coriobacteriia bacterium]|nr:ComEA family DNA-binding protein [Coriobacteriia bacterium]